MLFESMIKSSQDSTVLLLLLFLIPKKDLALESFMNMITKQRGAPSIPLANLISSKPKLMTARRLLVTNNALNLLKVRLYLSLLIQVWNISIPFTHPLTLIDSYSHVVFVPPQEWDPILFLILLLTLEIIAFFATNTNRIFRY